MAEDWAAVARAISERMEELGLTQSQLIERSQVSKATVGELQHNSAQRRRSIRTLEALATALELHPMHLVAVLAGRRVPTVGEPVSRSDDDVRGRLAAIEYRLEQIAKQLDAIDELRDQLSEIKASMHALASFVVANGKNMER